MHAHSPIRILFVCMGNICRSPLAEGILRHLLAEKGREQDCIIDSAGTGNWHVGELPDARMRAEAAGNGITLEMRARQVRDEDFHAYDLIICMDEDNRERLLAWESCQPGKVCLLLERWGGSTAPRDVPDPYYGGVDGFTRVYELVEAACREMVEELVPTPGV